MGVVETSIVWYNNKVVVKHYLSHKEKLTMTEETKMYYDRMYHLIDRIKYWENRNEKIYNTLISSVEDMTDTLSQQKEFYCMDYMGDQ